MADRSVERSGAGRLAALERAYLEHRDRLLTLAAALVGERALAEDVVHDVFANLASSTFDPSGNGTGAYLTVCARNAALSALRSRKVASEHAGRLAVRRSPGGSDPVRAAENAEEAAAALRLFAGLPEDEREALALRVWGGMTFEDIARLQAVSKATAHARCRAALAKLRSLMK